MTSTAASSINAARLRFEVAGSGYLPGDDRPYDVWHGGRLLGVVEKDWAPAARPGGDLVAVWNFRSADHARIGQGRTRAAAVLDAF